MGVKVCEELRLPTDLNDGRLMCQHVTVALLPCEREGVHGSLGAGGAAADSTDGRRCCQHQGLEHVAFQCHGCATIPSLWQPEKLQEM